MKASCKHRLVKLKPVCWAVCCCLKDDTCIMGPFVRHIVQVKTEYMTKCMFDVVLRPLLVIMLADMSLIMCWYNYNCFSLLLSNIT